MKAGLYVFEGPDGVGKSTLASHLHNYLKQSGFPSELFSFPGREVGTLGELVYRLYHNPHSFGIRNISLTTEQLLFTAAHADVIENRILPALRKERNIVLDRYWWSTWVHSTIGNLNSEVRNLLIDFELTIWRHVKPSCIFLIRRNRPADSEHPTEKWQKLVSLYDNIRAQQANQVRIVDVDNTGGLKDAAQFVLEAVRTQLSGGEQPGSRNTK